MCCSPVFWTIGFWARDPNLSPHLAPVQPPPSPKRSHLVPTTHIHPTADYGATPLLRQVGGGCYSQGGVLPPQVGWVDPHMDTPSPTPLAAPPLTFTD